MLSVFYSFDYHNIETVVAGPVEYSTNVGLSDKKQSNASFSINVTLGTLFGIHDLDLAFFIKWDEQRLGQVPLHNSK